MLNLHHPPPPPQLSQRAPANSNPPLLHNILYCLSLSIWIALYRISESVMIYHQALIHEISTIVHCITARFSINLCSITECCLLFTEITLGFWSWAQKCKNHLRQEVIYFISTLPYQHTFFLCEGSIRCTGNNFMSSTREMMWIVAMNIRVPLVLHCITQNVRKKKK